MSNCSPSEKQSQFTQNMHSKLRFEREFQSKNQLNINENLLFLIKLN